jgi:hypothetical protein
MSLSSPLGLQFIHVAWTDNSLYQTKIVDVDNPQSIHYIEHSKVE